MNEISVKSKAYKKSYKKPEIEIVDFFEDILTSSKDDMSGGWEPFH